MNKSPFSVSRDETLSYYPPGCFLSDNDELFILSSFNSQHILIKSISSGNTIGIIELDGNQYMDIAYLNGCDGIVLLVRDMISHENSVRILLYWRKYLEANGGKIRIPTSHIYPLDWIFPPLDTSICSIINLATFQKHRNPVFEVYDNSICIVSEVIILIWDFFEKPVFRTAIVFPKTSSQIHFSFAGDYLAILPKDYLFILKISSAISEKPRPFTPGMRCFCISNELEIDYGLINDTNNFLFVPYYLNHHKIFVDILFQFRPPGYTNSIRFLSHKTLVIITTEATLACVYNSFNVSYDPVSLVHFNNITRISYNNNYTVLNSDDKVHYLANPSKYDLESSLFPIPTFWSENISRVLYILMNKHYEIIISKVSDSFRLRVFDLPHPSRIVDELVSIKNVDSKLLVSLSSPEDPRYLSFVLYQTLGSNHELFVWGLNDPPSVFSDQNKLFSIVVSLPTKYIKTIVLKHVFLIEYIKYVTHRINGNPRITDICNELTLFNQIFADLSHPENNHLLLFKAILYSCEGNNLQATELLEQIPFDFFFSIEKDTISILSNNMNPSILVQINQPELPNTKWELTERLMAHYYKNKDFQQVFIQAQLMIDHDVHFEQWSTKPNLISWIKGTALDQFIAGLCLQFNPQINEPGVYYNIYNGINHILREEYSKAIRIFGNQIDILGFIRSLNNDIKKLEVALQQIENEEIHIYIQQLLILHTSITNRKPVDNCRISEIQKNYSRLEKLLS